MQGLLKEILSNNKLGVHVAVSVHLTEEKKRYAVEVAIQVFAVVNLSVIGISHIARPRAWVAFFEWLKGRGEAGVFVTAFLSLGFGSIIVAFHNVWSGIPMILTLLGWAQILKALVYFTWPSYGLKKLQLVSEERANLVIIPGIAFVAVAALLLYNLAV